MQPLNAFCWHSVQSVQPPFWTGILCVASLHFVGQSQVSSWYLRLGWMQNRKKNTYHFGDTVRLLQWLGLLIVWRCLEPHSPHSKQVSVHTEVIHSSTCKGRYISSNFPGKKHYITWYYMINQWSNKHHHLKRKECFFRNNLKEPKVGEERVFGWWNQVFTKHVDLFFWLVFISRSPQMGAKNCVFLFNLFSLVMFKFTGDVHCDPYIGCEVASHRCVLWYFMWAH